MYSEELFNELQFPFNELYKKHGLEVITDICELASGDLFYVPSMRYLLRKKIGREIIRDYDNGMNFRELQRKYRMTSSAIKKVVYREKSCDKR